MNTTSPSRKRTLPLSAELRTELATLLDRDGFRTTCERSGISARCFKRARDGEGITPALVAAVTLLLMTSRSPNPPGGEAGG